MNAAKFVNDYIEAALWTSYDPLHECFLDARYSEADLAPETLKVIREDCQKFMAQCEGMEIETDHPGHDFLLTRNHHGAGFWDGDYPNNGDALSTIAGTFSEMELYVGDDNLIYQEGAES